MLNLEELEQLVAFKELGTLSKVAEQFLISTPSLSRSMQHVEEAFGVPLFDRSANRISLNETGERAVQVARRILETSQQGIHEVRDFDQSLKTITVVSVAPAPLWSLLPTLSSLYPDKQIQHKICTTSQVLEAIEKKTADLVVLPFAYEGDKVDFLPYLKESLDIVVPLDHALAKESSVSFSAIDGYNFLLMNQIGFWNDLVREKMPASKFLVQSSRFEFEELANNSTLPRFATNLSKDRKTLQGERAIIPLSDPEAKVTYYLVSLNPAIQLSELTDEKSE
ncbi:LysR family transcriptional regulator [Streptococcus lactarius]|uniref:LysR family transcriptional regulator n=1 Tax=Streptococcus lactarius TaxID=684066 RepID=A0A9X0WN94_9STRE|nr:LysR family transcriptional regulator [Streptococcus lactarius]MBK4779668.1 MerR family transcriptional regulator [Streptococcus lactarius]QUB38639.1 LysR family transcriptional regulator [Streptococcus lactarius]